MEKSNEFACKFVSSRGLMKSCKIHTSYPQSSTRIMEHYDFRTLETGETVYVCGSAIPHFKPMLNEIHCPFILVTGDCDESCPGDLFSSHEDFLAFIENPKIIRWYSQNCFPNHPKMVQIPIGLDYHTLSNIDNNQNILTHWWGDKMPPLDQELKIKRISNKAKPLTSRKLQAYSNFHFQMTTKFGQDRILAKAQIPAECVFYEPNRCPRLQSWKTQVKYAFVISPHGNGLDCHRTWEALCLGCIPIVKTSPLDPLYEGLPVWIVKEWSDVNLTLMSKILQEFDQKMQNNEWKMEKLTLEYWTKQIQGQ